MSPAKFALSKCGRHIRTSHLLYLPTSKAYALVPAHLLPGTSLACGHTFCQGCIQDWFSTCLVKHLEVYPNYDAQRLLRPELRAFLARPDLPPHARRKAECESIMMLLGTPQPEYSCPTCRVVIRTKPAENFVVKHVVRTIAGVQGEPYPTAAPAPRMPGMPTEGPFDAFFPPDLRLALNP